jgi:hypothetical protein
MKRISLIVLLLIGLRASAQTTIQEFVLSNDTNYVLNGIYVETGPSGIYADTFTGPGGAIDLYHFATYSALYLGTNTWTNSLINTPGMVLTNLSGSLTIQFLLLSQQTNWISTATNFWSVPNDIVRFRASGWNKSSGANSNQLVVAVDGNAVFTGPWTAAAGYAWQISGRVQWDGTNLNYAANFLSGDSNTPTAFDAGIITNVTIGHNTWTWTLVGDTNGLSFDSAAIAADRLPSNDIPIHYFGGNPLASIANYFVPPQTIATSTAAAAGAGQITWDTNYIYVSVGTNLWKRAAITNW